MIPTSDAKLQSSSNPHEYQIFDGEIPAPRQPAEYRTLEHPGDPCVKAQNPP